MLDQILAISCYLALFLIPGLGVATSLRSHSNLFLLTFAISASIVSISIAGVQILGIETHSSLFIFFLAICALSASITIFRLRLAPYSLDKLAVSEAVKSPTLSGHLLLTASIFATHFFFGTYTEIPSDFWKQLARVNSIFLHFSESGFSWAEQNVGFGFSGSSTIYFIHAGIAALLGSDPLSIASAATAASTWLFLSVVYYFTIYLTRSFGFSDRLATLTAFLATLFVWLTFGTATFSFVRYYAYFPVIFAFPLIYCSVFVFSNYLDNKAGLPSTITLLPLFLLAMWVMHPQEAMLSIIIIAILAFVRLFAQMVSSNNSSAETRFRVYASASVILIGSVLAIGIITRGAINPWGHTPHTVNAGKYLAALDGLPMDNPSFRLWDTIGFFGIIVYIWSIFQWRMIIRNEFLIAGLCVPFVTNLNPVFTIFLLHLTHETTLWRTAFLIPLGFAASFLVIYTFTSFKRPILSIGNGLKLFFPTLLFVSILPWHSVGFENRTSKVFSFVESSKLSGHLLWGDLISEVRRIDTQSPVKQIITDSMTSFVINSAVRGRISTWQDRNYFPKNNSSYAADFIGSDFSKSLLIINFRDGADTSTSSMAKHWPEGVLEVSRNYPDDLISFVQARADLFEKIWERDRIWIYAFKDWRDSDH